MKKIIATILLLSCLISLCACNNDATPSTSPSEQPTSTPETTPKPDLNISDFTVIYPQKTLLSSINAEASARLFADEVRKSTSIFMSIFDDRIDEADGWFEEKYEILIGETNRDETQSTLSKHLRYNDFIIKYIDTKLIINGGSDEALKNAVRYFAENYLNENLKTPEGWKEITTLDYEYIQDSNIKELYIDNVYINEFKISSTIDSLLIDKFIDEVLQNAGEKLTCPSVVTDWEHEIIIGDCGKPEYDKVAEGLTGNDYAIDVVDGDLVIASASEAGLTHALFTFYSEFLTQKSDKLNITGNMKFEYTRTYPINSITLCGQDINDYVIVANPNSKSLANRLSKEIEEMSGIVLDVVTDSPDNYDAAIILCSANDSTSKRILSTLADGKAIVKSENSNIYIGTNSISYGDSPAVNAFITEILGYDMDKGVAASKTVDVAQINLTVDIEDYRSKFVITHFFGIRPRFLENNDGTINTWRIDEAVEAGMNVIEVSGSPETVKQVLEYCDKRGDVRCNVSDWTLGHIGGTIRAGGELYDGWMDDIKTVVDRYKGYSSLYAYNIVDEPFFEEATLKKLGAVCALLEELDPARMQYINEVPLIDWITQHSTSQYDDFLKYTGVEMLSYDRYVFDDKNGRENAPIEGYYDNLEFARDAALKHNVQYMNIALLVDHYYDTENGTQYRYLNEAEISWQACISLAYGVNAFSYFTYASPANGTESDYPWVYNPEGGAISVDGEKTEHYYNIQNVNKRLQIMGDVLVDRLSLGVFHIEQQRTVSPEYGIDRLIGTKFEGFGTIDEIKTKDAVIGFFEDDFMVIANKDFDNAIDVEIKTTSKLLILDNDTGSWSELDPQHLTIEQGDAALIKIIK